MNPCPIPCIWNSSPNRAKTLIQGARAVPMEPSRKAKQRNSSTWSAYLSARNPLTNEPTKYPALLAIRAREISS